MGSGAIAKDGQCADAPKPTCDAAPSDGDGDRSWAAPKTPGLNPLGYWGSRAMAALLLGHRRADRRERRERSRWVEAATHPEGNRSAMGASRFRTLAPSAWPAWAAMRARMRAA